MTRLVEYLIARGEGQLGWRADYEAAIQERWHSAAPYATLAGHYAGLLEDLITALGGGQTALAIARAAEREGRI